jgi:hypothetical protein
MSLIGEILEHVCQKEKTEMEKFWAIWRGMSATQPRYETKDAAIAEASRLSAEHREKFVVMEAVGFVAPQDMPVNYFDLP